MSTIRKIQDEQKEWTKQNFGQQEYTDPFFGVVEEVGELAHGFLKLRQGIRGTEEELRGQIFDAIGDIEIYLMGVCNALGLDLEMVTEVTWTKVKLRNWKKNPTNGEVHA